MSQQYYASEVTAAKRRFHLHLVDPFDGITPIATETGGQPRISKNGAAPANTSAVLVAIDAAKGDYYVELTATELNTTGHILVEYINEGVVVAFSESAPVLPAIAAATASEVEQLLDQVVLEGLMGAVPSATHNIAPTSRTIATGIDGGGTIGALSVIDGDIQTTNHDTGDIDFYYEFDIPEGFVAVNAIVVGYPFGAADEKFEVYATNWATTRDQIGTLPVLDPDYDIDGYYNSYRGFNLLAAHTDSEDTNKVRIHFVATGTVNLDVDQILVGCLPVALTGAGGPLLEIKPIRYVEPGSILVFDFKVKNALISNDETDMNVGKTGLTEAAFTVDVVLGESTAFTTLVDADHAIIELGGGWYRLTAAADDFYTDEDGEAIVRISYDPDVVPEAGGYHTGVVWEERYVVSGVNVATIADGAITADALAVAALEAIADAVWSTVLEGSATAADMIRGGLSILAGKVTNFLTGTLVFKGAIDTAKTRWTVTTDETGRLTVTPGNLT